MFFGFLGGLFALIIFGGLLAVYVLYLVALRAALREVHPVNRKMPPGQVFLLLIPFVNLVYAFVLVGQLSDSLIAELRARGLPMTADRPTYRVGIAMSVLQVAPIVPVVGTLAILGYIICWILHWTQVNAVRRQLQAAPASAEGESLIFGSNYPQG